MRLDITTARCVIRPFLVSDLDGFMEYRNDQAWMRYQGFKGRSKEEYATVLMMDHSLTEGRQLAIADKASGHLIGDLYLQQDGDTVWIGYTIHPRFARQGYAYEAVSALCNWARGQGFSVKAGVLQGNDASIGLLTKLGFLMTGTSAEGELVFTLHGI